MILAKFEFGYKMNEPGSRCIIPGRFNPLHNGHLAVAHYIEKHLDRKTLFEIPVNYPKFTKLGNSSTLNLSANLQNIINQFKLMSRNVVLTDTVAFAAKSMVFPNSIFAIGPEVMAKLTDPVHYFNSINELVRHINIIKDNGCRFMVFPRNEEQAFYGVKIPKILSDIATFVDDFTPIQISSSEIRKELKKIDDLAEVNKKIAEVKSCQS
jgi:nicotinic acid mononucleotide adenylyltransferase